MPRRYSRRRKSRRYGRRRNTSRRSFKQFRRRGPRVSRKRLRSVIVPDRLSVKLRYQTIEYRTTGSGPAYVHIMSGNGPYDADQTHVGHQPTGWDQWSNFYNSYYVAASKISIEFQNLDASVPVIATLIPSQNEWTTADLINKIPWEETNARSKLIHVRDSGNSRLFMKHYWTTNKAMSTRASDIQSAMQASYNAVPASEWFWNLILQTHNGTDDLEIVYVVRVTYYVTFFGKWNLQYS